MNVDDIYEVKIQKAIRLRDLENDINTLQNGHATSNDAAVANAAAHAIAHRVTDDVAKEGFKTIRHQISIGKISDNDGWDTMFKAALVIGGIGLMGYLIYSIVKIIREQPDTALKIANAIQGKGTTT